MEKMIEVLKYSIKTTTSIATKIELERDLKKLQREALFEAWAYCDWQDKSTEFMLQYMQGAAGVDLDTVLEFIHGESKNRKQWYRDNPDWYKKYEIKRNLTSL